MSNSNKPAGGDTDEVVQMFIEQQSLLRMIRGEGEQIEKKFNFSLMSTIDECTTKEMAFELGAYRSLIAMSVMILAIGEASDKSEIDQIMDEAQRSTKQ